MSIDRDSDRSDSGHKVLRGVLIALVLHPFLGTITRWSYGKRLAGIADLYVVLGR
jgi:hypothetical protein